MVDEIVKPLTADKSCRVVDLPSVKATGAVGEAKVREQRFSWQYHVTDAAHDLPFPFLQSSTCSKHASDADENDPEFSVFGMFRFL